MLGDRSQIFCVSYISFVVLYLNALNYETVLLTVFVSLHLHRLERLLSTWPLTEVMWRLSVCCSRLELTLILWTKYVNIDNVMYVIWVAGRIMLGELDGHVHCTESLVPLCLSFILGNQVLMGKSKLDLHATKST